MIERLTKDQAAARLGVSTKTIDRKIARGELKSEREPGGRRRVMVLLDIDESTLDSLSDTTQETPDSLSDTVHPMSHKGSDSQSDTVQDTSRVNGVNGQQSEVEVLRTRVAELEALHQFDKERLVLADERIQDMRQMLASSQQTIDRLTLALPPPSSPPEAETSPWWKFW